MTMESIKLKITEIQKELQAIIDDYNNKRNLDKIQARYAALKNRVKEEYHRFHLRRNESGNIDCYQSLIDDIHAQSFSARTNDRVDVIIQSVIDAEDYCGYWLSQME